MKLNSLDTGISIYIFSRWVQSDLGCPLGFDLLVHIDRETLRYQSLRAEFPRSALCAWERDRRKWKAERSMTRGAFLFDASCHHFLLTDSFWIQFNSCLCVCAMRVFNVSLLSITVVVDSGALDLNASMQWETSNGINRTTDKINQKYST